MKFLKNVPVVTVTVICAALVGCGGNSSSIEHLPKGEGNIPIGRAQAKEMGESAVQIEMSDGRTYRTLTKNQVVYVPSLPRGLTSVTVTPANRRFSKYTMDYVAGSYQKWAFNIHPVNRVSTEVLKDIEVNLRDGETFHVGEKFDIEIGLIGENLDGLRATVIIDGGTAALDANDDLTFTKAGVGQLGLELLGFKRTVEFTVEP